LMAPNVAINIPPVNVSNAEPMKPAAAPARDASVNVRTPASARLAPKPLRRSRSMPMSSPLPRAAAKPTRSFGSTSTSRLYAAAAGGGQCVPPVMQGGWLFSPPRAVPRVWGDDRAACQACTHAVGTAREDDRYLTSEHDSRRVSVGKKGELLDEHVARFQR